MREKNLGYFLIAKIGFFSQASFDDPQVQRRGKRVIFTFLQLNILRLNMFDEKKTQDEFQNDFVTPVCGVKLQHRFLHTLMQPSSFIGVKIGKVC